MHVLIAENDAALSDGLAYCLRKGGHSVSLAMNGDAAVRAISAGGVDLLVLDFSLLKVSGTEVLKVFRTHSPQLPVLLISGLDDAYERVCQLGLRVDGYLPKPFGLREFATSVASLTDEHPASPPSTLRFGKLSCDPVRGLVLLGERPLDLPLHERRLLEMLVRHATRLSGNEEFAKQLADWRAELGENVAETRVNELRRHLENTGLEIVLVRGLGYRLVEAA